MKSRPAVKSFEQFIAHKIVLYKGQIEKLVPNGWPISQEILTVVNFWKLRFYLDPKNMYNKVLSTNSW